MLLKKNKAKKYNLNYIEQKDCWGILKSNKSFIIFPIKIENKKYYIYLRNKKKKLWKWKRKFWKLQKKINFLKPKSKLKIKKKYATKKLIRSKILKYYVPGNFLKKYKTKNWLNQQTKRRKNYWNKKKKKNKLNYRWNKRKNKGKWSWTLEYSLLILITLRYFKKYKKFEKQQNLNKIFLKYIFKPNWWIIFKQHQKLKVLSQWNKHNNPKKSKKIFYYTNFLPNIYLTSKSNKEKNYNSFYYWNFHNLKRNIKIGKTSYQNIFLYYRKKKSLNKKKIWKNKRYILNHWNNFSITFLKQNFLNFNSYYKIKSWQFSIGNEYLDIENYYKYIILNKSIPLEWWSKRIKKLKKININNQLINTSATFTNIYKLTTKTNLIKKWIKKQKRARNHLQWKFWNKRNLINKEIKKQKNNKVNNNFKSSLSLYYKSKYNLYWLRRKYKKKINYISKKQTKQYYYVQKLFYFKLKRDFYKYNNYKYLWQMNKQNNHYFKLFYLLKNKTYKKIISNYLSQKFNMFNSFLFYLESKLMIFLYRINLFPSLYFIKQIIQHKYILINNNIVTSGHYHLKIIKDEITIKFKSDKHKFHWLKHLLLNKKYVKTILVNYPQYLEINYRLLVGKFIRKPKKHELYFPSFKKKLNKLIYI